MFYISSTYRATLVYAILKDRLSVDGSISLSLCMWQSDIAKVRPHHQRKTYMGQSQATAHVFHHSITMLQKKNILPFFVTHDIVLSLERERATGLR